MAVHFSQTIKTRHYMFDFEEYCYICDCEVFGQSQISELVYIVKYLRNLNIPHKVQDVCIVCVNK